MQKNGSFRRFGIKKTGFVLRQACMLLIVGAIIGVIPIGKGVYASPGDMGKMKPLPDVKALSPEEWEANSQLIEETPMDDELLTFSVRLPQSWKRTIDGGDESPDNSNNLLRNVVTYIGPPLIDLRSRFFVEIQDLEYKIAAKDWLARYIIDNGFVLDSMHEIDERHVEALYVTFRNNDEYVRRAVMYINGSVIVLATFEMPYKYWSERRDIQTYAMNGFQLKTTSVEPIETIKSYSFLELVKFDYLGSWDLFDNQIRSIDKMEASLVKAPKFDVVYDPEEGKRSYFSERLQGRIDVTVIAKGLDVTLPDEISKLSAILTGQGLKLADLIERRDMYEYDKSVKFASVEAYKTNNKTQTLVGYEFWVAALETKHFYILVTLLGPNRDARYYQWAINAMAFQEVVQSVRQPNERRY